MLFDELFCKEQPKISLLSGIVSALRLFKVIHRHSPLLEKINTCEMKIFIKIAAEVLLAWIFMPVDMKSQTTQKW